MSEQANATMITKVFLRLLPIQILLAAVGAVNGIVNSLFASNYVGTAAMSAVGQYAPIMQFVGAVSLMIVGGSQILCGKYMGKNQVSRTQSIFSLAIMITVLFSMAVIILLVVGSLTDATKIMTKDDETRRILNQYILGQAIGILPSMLGQQMAAFLSLENQNFRTTLASLIFIAVNVVLNFLFVALLRWEAFGLALASSLGLWVFLFVQLQYYFSGKSLLKFKMRTVQARDAGEIIKIGFPGAISNGYQTLRRLIVNSLILTFVGGMGMSAFAAMDSFVGIFWAIPSGILAVSRMLMSVSIGEEDRRTLVDIMKTALYKMIWIMIICSALLIIFAVPITRMYYRDPSEPVYRMTIWSFRLLPICMPLSIIMMHFACYGQISGKQILVHILSALDGVICVAGFSAILVPLIGLNGVYIANIGNGLVCVIVIILYSVIKRKKFPRNMEEAMVIPDDFGVSEDERMDLTVKDMSQVVSISRQVQAFCEQRGIDARRCYLAGLFMEEMAGNVVDHGFTKDKKNHTVDIRVVHKEDTVILRIKDDCKPFDPAERAGIVDPEDITKNIGIRMVYSIADDISYQNILGLNVLTIRF